MQKLKCIATILAISIVEFFGNCGKRFPMLGDGYLLDYDSRNDVMIIDSNDYVIIAGHIVDFNYDSSFIIAKQKPRDSIPECRYLNDEAYSDCAAAFEKSTLRQFWIINKYNDSAYGPLKEEEYIGKREQIGVPRALRLKEE